MTPNVLVLGASGTVGCGIVAALLDAGARVIGVGRDQDRLDKLQSCTGSNPALQLLNASVTDDSDAAALVKTLRERGVTLSAVVASLSSPLEAGRLLDQPAAFLRGKLDADLIPHLAAARHLLPLLGENENSADYVLIGGPGADNAWCGYGHASVAAAAMQMLARVLHGEAQSLGVRVQLLAVDRPVSTDANQHNSCPEWTSAVAVGRQVVQLLSRRAPPRPIVPYPANATTNSSPAFQPHYEVF